MANVPSFFHLARRTEEGGRWAPAALGPAVLGLAASGKEWERRRGVRGIDSPPRFEGWRPVEAAPRRRAAAGPGRCGSGAAVSLWRLGLGENDEGSEGTLLLSSPWARMERGGRPTAVDGEQQWRPWRRRFGLGRKARGGGGGGGGRELREGATYSPGEAVERAGKVAG